MGVKHRQLAATAIVAITRRQTAPLTRQATHATTDEGPQQIGMSRIVATSKLPVLRCAPLGPVLMSPDNGRNRAPQILWRGLALGPARLDQRLQAHPLRAHEHGSSSSRRGKTLVIRTGSSSNRP